jgi:hypothetical protein
MNWDDWLSAVIFIGFMLLWFVVLPRLGVST